MRGSEANTLPSWKPDHYESTHDECDILKVLIDRSVLAPKDDSEVRADGERRKFNFTPSFTPCFRDT